jgi:hypothetical protein
LILYYFLLFKKTQYDQSNSNHCSNHNNQRQSNNNYNRSSYNNNNKHRQYQQNNNYYINQNHHNNNRHYENSNMKKLETQNNINDNVLSATIKSIQLNQVSALLQTTTPKAKTPETPNIQQSSNSSKIQYQAAPFQPPAYHNNSHCKSQNNRNNHQKNGNYHNNNNNNSHQHLNQYNNQANRNIHHLQPNGCMSRNNIQFTTTNFSHHLTQIQQQKNKILIEKYDRKFNLISFILLRKKDEYLRDDKFYLNDQFLYQKVNEFIEKRDIQKLTELFNNEDSFNGQNENDAYLNNETSEEEEEEKEGEIESKDITNQVSTPTTKQSNLHMFYLKI